MDAPCKIQGSIHVFRLVNNMCPGKWVHITKEAFIISYVYPLHIYVKSEVSGQITHSPMCHFFHIKYCTSKIFNRQEFIHYFFMNSSKTFNVKKNNQQNI